MFAEIRNRLTIQYTVVMAVFLAAFIAVCYSGVLWVLYREEMQDVQALAQEEARTHIALLKRSELRWEAQSVDKEAEGGKIFFYVFDRQGRLAAAEEPIAPIRPHIRKIIDNWQIPSGQGKIQRFHQANGERAIVIMCSAEITDEQEVLGKVFVGEDITSYYQLLKTLLIVLLAAAVVFLLIAAVAGHALAGRAIIPIKQSFSRQREFVADASHELRTPLSILLTSVDAVRGDEDNRLSPFSGQVLADMKHEIRRMSKLVADLLTLARADAGVANIIKEKFDISAVAEQILRSFQPLADEQGVKLEFKTACGRLILADRERISQLLVILLDNAIKYTPAGGKVAVSIETATGQKPGVSVIVRDTGIGIPEKQRQLIFERFYRIDKARSREEGGAGLGLSIAKWIVNAHGGAIRVESNPGGGSAFIVNLPA